MAGEFRLGVSEALRRQYRRGGVARLLLAGPVALRRRLQARDSRIARAIMERLGSRIVGDVVLDVPEFAGQFACSVRSDLFARIAATGTYEPGLAALLRQHLDPERDFIDAGANIGFYSVLAAKCNPQRRVLAIEPNPEALRLLTGNVARNGVAGCVMIHEGLVSDRAGAADLNIIEGMAEYSSLGAIAHSAVAGRESRVVTAVAATLDQLVARHDLKPGLIKIDVEGAEGLVLAGAAATLERFRPVLLSEFSPVLLRRMGADPAAIIADLLALGYRVLDADDPREAPGQRDYGDIVCLPA